MWTKERKIPEVNPCKDISKESRRVIKYIPSSSVHGILHARILEWVVLPFFRGSSQPRD